MNTPQLLKTRSSISLLGAAMIITTINTQAALIAYEGFNYSAGQLAGQTPGTGSGFSGSWFTASGAAAETTVNSSGFTYTGLASQGGSGQILQDASKAHTGAFLNLSTTLAATNNTYYISFLARYDGTSANDSAYLFLDLYSGTSISVASLGKQSVANTGVWGINTRSNGGSVFYDTGGPTVDNLALLVYKIQFTSANNATMSLFVNPDLSMGEPGTADATGPRVNTTAVSTWDTIRFQSNNDASIDEIRIGTTWADVVPEPSSAMLGLLGSSLLLIRKRREA